MDILAVVGALALSLTLSVAISAAMLRLVLYAAFEDQRRVWKATDPTFARDAEIGTPGGRVRRGSFS